MAELADALDSGSSLCKEVQVQVLLPAPNEKGYALCISLFVSYRVIDAEPLQFADLDGFARIAILKNLLHFVRKARFLSPVTRTKSKRTPNGVRFCFE